MSHNRFARHVFARGAISYEKLVPFFAKGRVDTDDQITLKNLAQGHQEKLNVIIFFIRPVRRNKHCLATKFNDGCWGVGGAMRQLQAIHELPPT